MGKLHRGQFILDFTIYKTGNHVAFMTNAQRLPILIKAIPKNTWSMSSQTQTYPVNGWNNKAKPEMRNATFILVIN